MKVNAIVLAAGSGSRMKSKTKKQFMTIKGKPVIWFALNAFQKSRVDEIILVTSKEDGDYCKNIIKKYNLTKVSSIIEGGKERYNSVYNGLKETKCDYVLIHDGARPLINQQIIDNCINGAIKYKACVAGVPVKDTIKIVDEKGIVIDTPPRNQIWITQTPQAFEDKLIREAYENIERSDNALITDDAMVVEKYGNAKVHFVKGAYDNIKITTPEDIILCECLMQNKHV